MARVAMKTLCGKFHNATVGVRRRVVVVFFMLQRTLANLPVNTCFAALFMQIGLVFAFSSVRQKILQDTFKGCVDQLLRCGMPWRKSGPDGHD